MKNAFQVAICQQTQFCDPLNMKDDFLGFPLWTIMVASAHVQVPNKIFNGC